MRKIFLILLVGIAIGFLLSWFVSPYSYLPARQTTLVAGGVSASSAPITAYFSPSPEPEQAILHTLQGAQQSVHIALYQLTDPEIAQELLDTLNRGIELQILLDDEPSKGSKGCLLWSKGIAVKQYVDSGIMHHKFAVVDGQKLITGSYNWTTSAQTRNEENLLIIESRELSEVFEREFQKLWTSKKAQLLDEKTCSH
jgi:phosphatidylserine/phosphatidylglycerophosphate/cardiolipin synthase-like enzyme